MSIWSQLSNGWQALKQTVLTFTSSKPATPKMVEMHTFKDHSSGLTSMHAKFKADHDKCLKQVRAQSAARKPLTQAHVEQIQLVFADYFKLLKQANKENNVSMASELNKMFSSMSTNYFQRAPTVTRVTRQAARVTAAKPVGNNTLTVTADASRPNTSIAA